MPLFAYLWFSKVGKEQHRIIFFNCAIEKEKYRRICDFFIFDIFNYLRRSNVSALGNLCYCEVLELRHPISFDLPAQHVALISRINFQDEKNYQKLLHQKANQASNSRIKLCGYSL